ncbi:hypothetical protein F511_26976 [Dorcoceras hygrometricum]|uniref:Dystroglycan-like n=1 Tax=Dorcoceras hygrometricum TaxID=472368 RepID=A0A2Z7BF89_9LAMI|nr:hypothetical protein F511_26976 [Dorcoceras hygrometricum]
MAASFYSNSVHVDFESVLAMGEPGMVSMFQALIASGLQGFLGCPAVVYEDALVEFFANGTVRDGIVSLSGEPVILSVSKNQMKMHYRLLCDIMAKSISVKAGSFNAITVENFSLMTVVVCDVRMNWGSVLFAIFKKMVTPGSKQAKGFAIQISLLLDSVPHLELGEPSEFPSSKILANKTIQRYISTIDKSGEQEPAVAPKVKKAPKTKVASKKRPADFSLDVPVLKKKRTSKRKSTLEMVEVAQEAVPIHMIETSTVAPAVEVPAEETRCSSADDVDVIIQQVIEETLEVDAPADRHQPPATEERHWFDLPYEDLIEKWVAERPVVTLHKIEQGFRDSMHEQAAVVKKLFHEAFQEGRSMDDVQTLRFNEFRKNILAQNASIFVGLADVRKEVQEVNTKVDIMASRLNDIQKDAEATKEALSHQLFEFQSQAQENQNILHAQLSELVDYIHRGSADKKGESGSRGPQQTSNVKIEGSAVRTPTFAQRVEMAQIHIVHTVLDADANRALLERQAAAERDRERRRREARMLKRRRRD